MWDGRYQKQCQLLEWRHEAIRENDMGTGRKMHNVKACKPGITVKSKGFGIRKTWA